MMYVVEVEVDAGESEREEIGSEQVAGVDDSAPCLADAAGHGEPRRARTSASASSDRSCVMS